MESGPKGRAPVCETLSIQPDLLGHRRGRGGGGVRSGGRALSVVDGRRLRARSQDAHRSAYSGEHRHGHGRLGGHLQAWLLGWQLPRCFFVFPTKHSLMDICISENDKKNSKSRIPGPFGVHYKFFPRARAVFFVEPVRGTSNDGSGLWLQIPSVMDLVLTRVERYGMFVSSMLASFFCMTFYFSSDCFMVP